MALKNWPKPTLLAQRLHNFLFLFGHRLNPFRSHPDPATPPGPVQCVQGSACRAWTGLNVTAFPLPLAGLKPSTCWVNLIPWERLVHWDETGVTVRAPKGEAIYRLPRVLSAWRASVTLSRPGPQPRWGARAADETVSGLQGP